MNQPNYYTGKNGEHFFIPQRLQYYILAPFRDTAFTNLKHLTENFVTHFFRGYN